MMSNLSTRLRELADKLDQGQCGLDADEMEALTQMICHVKVTLEEVCHRKGFSRATLDRRIQCGQFPEPHKDPGGKKYYYWDEVMNLE